MAKTIVQYSGFFDSIGATPSDAGDIREYPAQEFSIHVKELFTDGVKRDQLQVVPSDTPYTVGVELGFACIQGRYYSMVLEGVSDGDDPQYLPLEFEAAETLTLHINLGALENECCRASFVRGAFLAGGSVTDPAKSYHLELATTHASVSRELCSVLLELGFEPGQAMRGANYVTYMKQSEAIADFLTAVGAPVAALDVMSAKVERDMRNEINRKVNCDTANADKTVAAAQEQLAAIRAVEQEYGLDGLPEGLQQAALLRIANPEASLADLAMLSSPAVTKSCLSHRLKRLVELGRGIGKGD